MNILMVEDNVQDADLLAATLRRVDSDTRIDCAQTLSQACRQVREVEYDAVILDLGLPDSGGLSTVRRLLSANDCVPIVVMSGRDDDDLAKQAVHLGADDFIVKGERKASGILRAIHYAIERHRNADEIRYLAQHDSLTGAVNRTEFLRELDRLTASELRRKQPIGVFVLNLDHFQKINERYGYEFGDELLKECGRRISSSVKAGDLVARLQGDQLAILVSGLTGDRAAELVGERLHSALAAPICVGSQELSVTVTIGIALFPKDGTQAEVLLAEAESAMRDGKEHGRNRTHFYSKDTSQRLRRRRDFRRDLETAIERDQIEIWYQPRFKRDDQVIHSVAALPSWRHPTRGLIGSERLYREAEGEELFQNVQEAGIDALVAQLCAWTARQVPFARASFPVSTDLFQVPIFPERVEMALLAKSVNPEQLEIDVPEDAFRCHVDRTIENLYKLHELGVGTTVSCAGSGPAPFYYLANVPTVNTRISGALIADLESYGTSAIVTALIGFAHELGLCVIADGVDTGSQFMRLANMRCDVFQGEYFLNPVTADDLGELLQIA